MPISLKLFQHFSCVPTITEGRIKPLLPRLYLQKIKNLIHTYRNMHARRCDSLAYNMLYRIGIFLRIKLLVFLLKLLRMCSRISLSAHMRLIFFHVRSTFLCIFAFLIHSIPCMLLHLCNLLYSSMLSSADCFNFRSKTQFFLF